MIKKSTSDNRRITIEKKIEAVEYLIEVKSNIKAAEKYGVSEQSIRNWKSTIGNLRKASKKKEKITLHNGPKLSEETIETDVKLLDFVIINRKLGIPIITLSLKPELLKIRPDILSISSHGQYEYGKMPFRKIPFRKCIISPKSHFAKSHFANSHFAKNPISPNPNSPKFSIY